MDQTTAFVWAAAIIAIAANIITGLAIRRLRRAYNEAKAEADEFFERWLTANQKFYAYEDDYPPRSQRQALRRSEIFQKDSSL